MVAAVVMADFVSKFEPLALPFLFVVAGGIWIQLFSDGSVAIDLYPVFLFTVSSCD